MRGRIILHGHRYVPSVPHLPPRAAWKPRIYKAFDPPAEHQCSERSSRALTQPDTSGQHSQHSEHGSPETVQEAAAAGRISYGSAHRPDQPGDSAGGPTPRVGLSRISTWARPAQRQYVRFTTAGQIPTWSAQARPTRSCTACSTYSLDNTQTRSAEGASLSAARDHHCRSGFLRGQQARPAARSCIVYNTCSLASTQARSAEGAALPAARDSTWD